MTPTNPVIWLLIACIDLYQFIVFAAVIMSLLLYFNILNRSSQVVYKINYFLSRLTEPLFAKIRKYIPPVGGFDLSPIIVLLALGFLKQAVVYYL